NTSPSPARTTGCSGSCRSNAAESCSIISISSRFHFGRLMTTTLTPSACLTSIGISKISPALEGGAPLPRGLQHPVAVERERRDAGHATAAGAAVRPGRPADDADDLGAARFVLENRRAGIAGAGAKPIARALADRIDQTNLQA